MTTTVDKVTAEAEAATERVFGAVLGGMEVLVIAIGDRLGYYRALDGMDLSSRQLADRTGTSLRYTREWMEHQAVSGFLTVVADGDADDRRFALAPGMAEVLARPEALTTMAPLARMVAAAGAQWTRIADGARSGAGLGWSEYGADMLESQADINAPPLLQLLPDAWLNAALPDIHQRLAAGEALSIADVGCGAGWASIGLARRFPNASVDAYDVDPATIELAKETIEASGVTDRVRVFDHDLAQGAPNADYDLAIAIECIHDMPNPVPVLASMRKMVHSSGAVLIADELVADEFTAPGDEVERLMYGYSTLVCLPDSMSGDPTVATGTVMRTSVLESYAKQAGFTKVEVLPVEHEMWRFYRLS